MPEPSVHDALDASWASANRWSVSSTQADTIAMSREPLGSIASNMWADDDGVYWWGEVPVPGRAGRWTPMLEPPPDQVSEPGHFIGPPDSTDPS